MLEVEGELTGKVVVVGVFLLERIRGTGVVSLKGEGSLWFVPLNWSMLLACFEVEDLWESL